MTGPEVTAAMKAEDVDAGLVETACRARWDAQGSTFTGYNGDVARTWDALATLFPTEAGNHRTVERHALAAVLPQIQAQALRDEADRAHTYGFSTGDRAVFVHGERARHLLHERADRLTDTTGEPTT